jgi:hypothetical protein
LRNKRSLRRCDFVPLYALEEGVRHDFICAVSSKTGTGIDAHQPSHEVTGFIREINPVFVPLDVSRKDILEDLLRRLGMKGRYAV